MVNENYKSTIIKNWSWKNKSILKCTKWQAPTCCIWPLFDIFLHTHPPVFLPPSVPLSSSSFNILYCFFVCRFYFNISFKFSPYFFYICIKTHCQKWFIRKTIVFFKKQYIYIICIYIYIHWRKFGICDVRN